MKVKIKKSIYCDKVTLKKLTKIADRNQRTVIGQIRHWIDTEEKNKTKITEYAKSRGGII